MSIKNIIFDSLQVIVAALVTISISAALIFFYRSSGESEKKVEMISRKSDLINSNQQVTTYSARVASSSITSNPPKTSDMISVASGTTDINKEKFIITFKKHTVMSSGGDETLKKIFFLLKRYEKLQAKIIGYSDAATGDEETNLRISLKRAKVIKSYLENLGVSSSRIQITGKGGANPIARNDTREGRKINRRVEISIY